jgi:hypothetical protein
MNRLLAAFTLLAMLGPGSARAHRLDADYALEPGGIRIEFFFADSGAAAANLAVTAQAVDGTTVDLGRTDANGAVRFLPASAGPWTVVGTGDGHSNNRNPLVVPADAVAGSRGAATQPSLRHGNAPPPGASESAATPGMPADAVSASPSSRAGVQARPRGGFPWKETAISFGFIAVLTVATLVMMRRSARLAARPTEADTMLHELAHLRAEMRALREENAQLRADRESRT